MIISGRNNNNDNHNSTSPRSFLSWKGKMNCYSVGLTYCPELASYTVRACRFLTGLSGFHVISVGNVSSGVVASVVRETLSVGIMMSSVWFSRVLDCCSV